MGTLGRDWEAVKTRLDAFPLRARFSSTLHIVDDINFYYLISITTQVLLQNDARELSFGEHVRRQLHGLSDT